MYGCIAPLVNTSLPDNEWDVMDGVIVGNKIAVTLTGKKVHGNATLQGAAPATRSTRTSSTTDRSRSSATTASCGTDGSR